MAYIALRMLFPSRGLSIPIWMQCSTRLDDRGARTQCLGKLTIAGFITGILSGLFGVGGGFLLIPALMGVAQVAIHYAMATSLVAIVIIASSGLLSNWQALAQISPAIPGLFLGGSALGMTVGTSVKRLCSPRLLQIIFGCGVLATAVFVLVRNA
jgi:uncharacterized membrane protein YfcA